MTTLDVPAARRLVGIRSSSTTHDDRLQQLIDAAYEQAAYFCGPLTASQVTETATVRRGQIRLRRPPVTGVSSIAGVVDLSGLLVLKRAGLVEGIPAGSLADGDVAVVYTSGYSTVPPSIEEGVRAWVKHRWTLDTSGSDTYGNEDVDAARDFTDLPNAVRNAWRPYLLATGRGFA